MKKNLLSMERRMGAQSPRSVMDGRTPRVSRMWNYGMDQHPAPESLLAELLVFLGICAVAALLMIWGINLI